MISFEHEAKGYHTVDDDQPIDGSAFHGFLRQAAAEYDRCCHELCTLRQACIVAEASDESRVASHELVGIIDLTQDTDNTLLRKLEDSHQEKFTSVIPGEVPCASRHSSKEKNSRRSGVDREARRKLNGSIVYASDAVKRLTVTDAESDYELVLDACWEQANQSTTKGRSQASTWKHAASVRTSNTAHEFDEAVLHNEYNGRLRRFISMPNSRRRTIWDIVGAILIIYDSIAIPLKVFDPPEIWFSVFMEMFTLVYWTVNMPASLFVGYLVQGKYELNPVMILRHYLSGWFCIDILVVLPDWFFTIAHWVGDGERQGSSVRLLRILRLVRCMRLLRLVKLKWLMALIEDHINNESVDILFNIVKMILCLVVVNHFIACIWFGTSLVTDGKSWTVVHGFDKSEWTYQYVTSFHWAITQFTPSSMRVEPQNTLERTLAILVVIFGLVGFSYLVGSITGSLTELRRMNEALMKQFWSLRRYLKKCEVDLELRLRIEKYLEHAWNVHKETAMGGDLPILKLLTDQLKNELNYAINYPHLAIHPLFVYLSTSSVFAMQRIATRALDTTKLARQETYFEPGMLAEKMSFVIAGKLVYTRDDDSEIVDKAEDWITEAVLWALDWVTLGDLIATDVSELLEVSKKDFVDTVQRTPQAFERIAAYARGFLKWIHDTPTESWTDVCQGEKVTAHIEVMLDSAEHLVSQEQARLLGARRKSEFH